MSKVLTPFLWNKFISCKCLQTLFLVFNFTTSETKKSFVTRTNALLVDTFISIDDVSVSIAIEEGCFNCGRYKNRELHRLSLLMLLGLSLIRIASITPADGSTSMIPISKLYLVLFVYLRWQVTWRVITQPTMITFLRFVLPQLFLDFYKSTFREFLNRAKRASIRARSDLVLPEWIWIIF